MPGMGTPPSVALSGFYVRLAQEVGLWFFVTAVLLVALFVVVGKLHGKSRAESCDNPIQLSDRILGSTQDRGRSFLRIALGSFWILDGLLQAQPAMASAFSSQVIGAVAGSQPAWMEYLLRWEAYLWQLHPLSFDVATVLIQIGIGVSILGGNGRSLASKAGLWVSIAWALVVWVGGEAMGGLLTRGASEIFGAPGAALFYAGAAALLLAPYSMWRDKKAARTIRYMIGATFMFGAVIQALPYENLWNGQRLSSMFHTMSTTPQPWFLSAPIAGIAHRITNAPAVWNGALVAIMAILAVGAFSRKGAKTWSWAAGLFIGATWWFGQDFGILGGVGTDPNIGLMLIVLIVTSELAQVNAATLVPASNTIDQPPRAKSSDWRNIVSVSGLTAIVTGVLTVLIVLPGALAGPSSFHVALPPPQMGPTVNLGTLGGEVNISIVASIGRLQVSLQSPDSVATPKPTNHRALFSISGLANSVFKKPQPLTFLQCGGGCFVANIHWMNGQNHVQLRAKAYGWQGGTVLFDIHWPVQTDPKLLEKVLSTMHQVRYMVASESVTSNTNGRTFESANAHISGPEFLAGQPYNLEAPTGGVVLLAHSHYSTQLGLAYPTAGIYVQLEVGPGNHVLSEQITSPQHIVYATFHYL